MAISHVVSDSVFVVQGLAELKELAGVDKDVDEDEDLGLLEQEASMPLHELLAKMKEVCKRFKFCDDDDDDEDDNNNNNNNNNYNNSTSLSF